MLLVPSTQGKGSPAQQLQGWTAARQHWLFPVALVLCAFVSPLCGMIFGFSGTDTDYHMGSWFDVARDWKSGVLVPSWAAGANYGLGDPRFCFYPPIPMLIGSLAFLLLPVRLVMGAIFWITFILAGLNMYLLSRRFVSRSRSQAAAVLYTLSYFLLLTALKHGAIAELMTDAFMPLLIAFFVDALHTDQFSTWARFTFLLALTWLVDVPVAVATAYTLTIATLLVALAQRKAGPLGRILAAQAIGVLCAGFYLIPAFLSKNTIYSADKLQFAVRTLFVSHTLQDLTLSLDALVLAVVVTSVFWRRFKDPHLRPVLIVLALGLIGFFFQLPLSRPLWFHLPELNLVGFPHRFQVFLAIAFPLALCIGQYRRSVIFGAVIASALLACVPFYSFYVWAHRAGPRDTAAQAVIKIAHGYVGAPEYIPIHTGAVWVNEDNQKLAARIPLVQAVHGQGCRAQVERWDPEFRLVRVQGALCDVALKLFLHPYGKFSIDNHPVRAIAGQLGLAQVRVPAGDHLLAVHFERPLPPMLAGWVVTLLACGFLVAASAVPSFAQLAIPRFAWPVLQPLSLSDPRWTREPAASLSSYRPNAAYQDAADQDAADQDAAYQDVAYQGSSDTPAPTRPVLSPLSPDLGYTGRYVPGQLSGGNAGQLPNQVLSAVPDPFARQPAGQAPGTTPLRPQPPRPGVTSPYPFTKPPRP